MVAHYSFSLSTTHASLQLTAQLISQSAAVNVTPASWAAQYNTWLLIKLAPKRAVFSFFPTPAYVLRRTVCPLPLGHSCVGSDSVDNCMWCGAVCHQACQAAAASAVQLCCAHSQCCEGLPSPHLPGPLTLRGPAVCCRGESYSHTHLAASCAAPERRS